MGITGLPKNGTEWKEWGQLLWDAGRAGRGRAGGHLRSHSRRMLRRVATAMALHNRSLTVRLAVLVLPPTLVAAAFGLLRVTGAHSAEDALADAGRFAAISRASVAATEALEDERNLAAGINRSDRARSRLASAYAASDRAVAALTSSVAGAPEEVLSFAQDELRGRLDGLGQLRREAFTSALPVTATVSRYGALILNVIHLGRTADSRAVLLAGDRTVAGYTVGIDDLVMAAGLASQRQAVGTAVLARGEADRRERAVLGSFGTLVQLETSSFRSAAAPQTLTAFQAAGVEAAGAEVEALARQINQSGGGEIDVSAQRWSELTTLHIEKLRQVIRYAVDGAAADVEALRRSRSTSAWINLLAVAGVLLGMVVLATGVCRGLIGDLRRLREHMRRIAQHGPADLTATGGPTGPREAAGHPVGDGEPAAGHRSGPHGTDEIGQVARAFDTVHGEAVRQATAQAARRDAVAGSSRTLTRRTQNLIARQLTLITQLEQREVDPANLERFFELDHLAARIRRYGESLLVLTGAGPAWRWARPAALTEIAQAAASAIDDYRRVEIGSLPAVRVRSDAVVALIQVLTELIDNAARFSASELPVHVSARRSDAGEIWVEVRDHGYGLGPRTAAALNARIRRPDMEHLGDEQTLGLYVVGVLAARSGLDARLVSYDDGCGAFVIVPPSVLEGAEDATPPAAGSAPEPVRATGTESSEAGPHLAGVAAGRT